MGGKAGNTAANTTSSSSLAQVTRTTALDLLRKADDSLALLARNNGENRDITSRLHDENWIQLVFGAMNDSKAPLAELRFLSRVFEKIVDFIISDPSCVVEDAAKSVLRNQRADFIKFLNELYSAEIVFYGASLWLAYCKLTVTLFGTKMPAKDWNDFFTTMETWFKISDREAVVICLGAWTSFISFVAPKLSSGVLRDKLFATFSKPLRSHAVINKLPTPAPIISAYTALITSSFSNVDERFEELIICFLCFLIGKPVVASKDEKIIEAEIAKPVQEKSFNLVLEGASTDFSDYLTDPRPHRVFNNGALTHVFPLICSILGAANSRGEIPVCANAPDLMLKYGVFLGQVLRIAGHESSSEADANSICSCFAELGRRIEAIKDADARHRESRFLFIQIRAWIGESRRKVEEIEGALCQLFRAQNLSIHANSVGEWPALNFLKAMLEKSPAKISEFLEIIPETLRGGLETDGIVLERLNHICGVIEEHINVFDKQSVLKTWSQLSSLLTDYIKKTDDINEGNLLKPNFSTTFKLLALLFKIANQVDEDVSVDIMKKCSTEFSRLYTEVQTTVRHEVDCRAETVLSGVFGSTAAPETICCLHMFTTALSDIVDIYPFESISKKEVHFGTSLEFNALGELSTFANVIQLLGGKLIRVINEDKAEKLPRTVPGDFLTLLIICQKLFAAIEEPSLIRVLFTTLCGTLGEMLGKIYGDDSRLKEITPSSLTAYLEIVESVKSKITGPFDDGLLSDCAPLLTRLLSGRRGRFSKLRTASCDLWKNTFAKAQSLTYPMELRNVLLPLVQKRVISVPGFFKVDESCGCALSGDEDTSFSTTSSASQSSSRPRRTRRSAKIEENSEYCEVVLHNSTPVALSSSQIGKRRSQAKTDSNETKVLKRESFVMVKSEGKRRNVDTKEKVVFDESHKPEEITPSRQVATPRTKRRMRGGLLDEDSVDYVPIASSESAKKMKLTDRQREMFSEKRDRMPFLDEDSQNSAVIAHLPSEFDVELSQSVSNCPAKKDKAISDDAMVVENQIEREQGLLLKEGAPSVSPMVDVKAEKVVEEKASSRRKPKLKLNFDQIKHCEDSSSSPGPNAYSQSENSDEVEMSQKLSDLQTACNGSIADEVSSSEESTAPTVENDSDENVENDAPLGCRRSRKKSNPSKYVAQKRRESIKITEKEKRTLQSPSTKIRESSGKVVDEELPKELSDPKTPPPLSQEEIAQQNNETPILREIDEVLNVIDSKSRSADGSSDEKNLETAVTETPEKQNTETEKIAATPIHTLVQKISGTPGILKKVDSPSTAEKKFRRVHFGDALENNEPHAVNDDPVKVITADDHIPVSPKGVMKKTTPRRPFFHLQTTFEQVSKVAALPNESIAASPVKSEADSASSADDEPIFPRLADCQESIGRIVGRLLSISSTSSAIAARKSLEAQGIVKICDLASKSRREVSLLNIKKPRIETAFRTLSQFAREHLKTDTTPTLVQESPSKQESSAEPVEVQEDVDLEFLRQNPTVPAASTTVAIPENSEAELHIAESDGVEAIERPPLAPEYSTENGTGIDMREVEAENIEEPIIDERKTLFDAVREAYGRVEAEMEKDGATADLVRLRRTASRAARALLDIVTWCDDSSS
uniref:Rif1_N domain-containing protein n=1 Tax=Haemonchus contortus TaxID=6289 RepID=A0A7I4YPC4_HAECO